MRVLFLYPPPWKIPADGQRPDCEDGPPEGYRATDIDGDFFQMPYGVLTLASVVREAGHRVKVLNLSNFSWEKVEEVIDNVEADVFGMSCFTANRRGVALVARAIKGRYPKACVVVGGPHVTALARETLLYIPDVDVVVMGEGERTLLEVLDRIGRGVGFGGVCGVAYRAGESVVVGERRGRVRDLDTIPYPHKYYRTHLFMTSRGCPGECTFCAKGTVWGRVYRVHSWEYVLDGFEAALARLPVKMVLVKDDTFTVDRKRVIRICDGIRSRKLNFLWSCDTRVDMLDEELLVSMRLAGCVRLSLGVESGSPTILRNIRKKVGLEQVLHATKLAKRVGMQVRYYMMLGNRGETSATLQETFAFLRSAAPHQAIFACLSIYPGTDDFQLMQNNGWIDSEIFFKEDFQEIKTPFDASDADTQLMSDWFEMNRGLRTLHIPSVQECVEILARFTNLHTAHMDLGAAYFRTGALDQATHHIQKALDLRYPAPGLANNFLACICATKKDYTGMMAYLKQAQYDPYYPVLARNLLIIKNWQAKGCPPDCTLPLIARHDFELMELPEQPSLPGPLPPDYSSWEENDC